MNRRTILMSSLSAALLLGVGAAVVPGPSPARAGEMEIHPDDRILGAESAPVTIIEYSSLTCPHCAALHRDTLPQVKESWIEPGRARLVFRHYPLDGLALRAAAVADCVEGDRFFAFLELLFKSQSRWAKSDDPLKALEQMARLAGMSGETFETCVNDETAMDRILARAQQGRDTFGIEATPTLIIDGRRVQGARSYEEIDAVLRAAEDA
jgi:protein-disulfide isomerase